MASRLKQIMLQVPVCCLLPDKQQQHLSHIVPQQPCSACYTHLPAVVAVAVAAAAAADAPHLSAAVRGLLLME
jgi:hypothetical protein